MTFSIVPYGKYQVTQSGDLYQAKLGDTLHRVTKHLLKLRNGETRDISFREYTLCVKAISNPEAIKFVKLDSGEIIALSAIFSIKPYDVIIDERKEDL